MTKIELEELRDWLEDSSLNFAPHDWNHLRLISPEGEPVGSWRLSELVDGLIEIMATPEERDDMLDLANHLGGMALRIRRVIDDIEKD